MVNRIRKGRKAEKELADILKEHGYIVWRPVWNRFHSKDIFNIADIIAVRSNNQTDTIFHRTKNPIVFIQVKTNKTHFYSAKNQMRKFLEMCDNPEELHLVVALRIRKNIWRFREFYDDKLEDFTVSFDSG